MMDKLLTLIKNNSKKITIVVPAFGTTFVFVVYI